MKRRNFIKTMLASGIPFFIPKGYAQLPGSSGDPSLVFSTSQLLPVPIVAGGNFVRVGFHHHYGASSNDSVTFTPAAGNFLVCFASQSGVTNITISDNSGGNVWTSRQQVNMAGSSGRLAAFTSPTVLGVSTTVSVTASGGSDFGITVIEYSGVTGLDNSGSAAGSTSAPSFTTSHTCIFVGGWADETSGPLTSQTLTPGSIAATTIGTTDNVHLDGQYEWLNGSAGFSAGTYTGTVVGDANGASALLALF